MAGFATPSIPFKPVRLHRGEPAVLFSAEEVRDIAKLLNWLLLASFHLAALLWMPWAMKDSIDQKLTYYRVELFNSVLDIQLKELNSRLDERKEKR